MSETQMIENQGTRAQKIVTIYDDIYDLPDCRSYYRAMDHAGFRTAHFATMAFRKALTALKTERALTRANVVDFASGYGIAAQLMRHVIGLDDVLSRYREAWFDDATEADVIAADHAWLAHNRRDETDRYIGIDIAGNALSYGRDVGIFDAIFPENLQDGAPSAKLTAELAEVDLIVECGSVAHMLPDALDHLLSACPRKPWVILSPIRGNDTAEAFEVLKAHGLRVDDAVSDPFPHRAFSNADEQRRAIANAQARGYDTEGLESNGHFHAQIFLAKPA
ncbi:MAG: hypothetical protein AAFY35_15215 [Pseudomonadota bacterium]